MKRRKIAVIAGIILLLVSAFSAIFVLFFEGTMPQKPQDSTRHYLSFNGSESRIAMVSTTSSFTPTNQTYTSADGKQVAKGGLYTINLTLRNDYSSDNPPPSTGTPTAPIDGTAYIFLKATLLVYDVAYPSINLSPSDFTTTSADQTGLVLASGQTNTVQMILATNQTNINDFFVTLVSVTDSIPLNR